MKSLIPVLAIVVAVISLSIACNRGEPQAVVQPGPGPGAAGTPGPEAADATPAADSPAGSGQVTTLSSSAEASITVTRNPNPNPTPTPSPQPGTAPTEVAAAATPTPTPEASPTPVPTPTPDPITELHLMGVRTQVRVPNQVQFRFSLRDESNQTIFLPSQEIRAGARVFERAVAEEAGQLVEVGEWEEIDYSETNLFVHGAENLRLEVVFILDFTNSMAEGKVSDGTGNIQAMLESFFQALNVLPEAHRVGVVEFHDRNVGPSVLSDLTTDREVVRKAVSAFLTSPFDHGSSRLWDSVELASTLLTRGQENPDLTRAIVFYSDGRDTSSLPTRSEIGELASSNDIQLYAVGTGQVFEKQVLVNMVLATGGAYYSADDLRGLQSNQLGFLINDLLGQYKISYLTLRREGSHLVRLELTLGEIIGIYESGAVDTSTFLGPDTEGRIVFDPPSQDREQARAEVFVRALHVPRNITRFRFRLDTLKPVQIQVVDQDEGGLLHGWELKGPDAQGFYELSSEQPLEFGNFGLLFEVTISDVTEEFLAVPVEFDNSIYTAGKSFDHPPSIILGTLVIPPGLQEGLYRPSNDEG